jgi:hypothetical protein
MIDDLLAKAGELISQMSTVEWIIAVVILALLALGIVKQVAKIAVLAVGLMAVGVFFLNAQAQNWQVSF